MNNTEIFIEKYKEFEKTVQVSFGVSTSDSASFAVKNKPGFNKYKSDIEYCAGVRNLIQHREKVNNSFAVEPNAAMIMFLEDLINRIKNRKKCIDICVNINKVFSCSKGSVVIDLMREMNAKCFTHVPVLENGLVTGVFDENALFKYASEEEIIAIDQDLIIDNIFKYVSPLEREMEEFIFVKRDMYVDDLQEIVLENTRKGKRIGAAFVTANGKRNEKILGLITPWDMIGN